MGYRIVRITQELFTEMMTDGRRVPPRPGKRLRVVKGLPEGAVLEGINSRSLLNDSVIETRWSHPSWDEVPSGHVYPRLDIEFALEDDLPDTAGDLTPMEELALRRHHTEG